MAPHKPDNWRLTYGIYGAVGIQFVAAIAAGMWIGGYLDQRFGTTPWLGVTGILIGMVGGFWNLFRILKWKEGRDEDRSNGTH